METDLSIARKGPIPKLYGRIADDLRRRILSGEFTDRIPGEREIARAYEAHVLTANKAVTALVKEGLLRRVRGVGAFVTRLRRPRTMVLAAVVGNVERPLHGRVVRGMEAAARERGQHLLFANHLWSPEREEQSLRRLIEEERVDGFLVWPTDMRLESPGMQRLLHSGIPFVVFPHVGRDRRHDVSVVLSDDAAGARLAVRHLIDAGHRRIGIVILSRRGGMARNSSRTAWPDSPLRTRSPGWRPARPSKPGRNPPGSATRPSWRNESAAANSPRSSASPATWRST